jgi:hypothetical protein
VEANLVDFNGFEQSLEVASTETFVVATLNDFVEESRTIFDGLGENLQEVALNRKGGSGEREREREGG